MILNIYYFSGNKINCIVYEALRKWIVFECLKYEIEAKSVSIIFMNDEDLKMKNIEILNHDYYTDIITLDYSFYNNLVADLFISTERISENALKFNTEFLNELLRVIIHGVLHITGIKDKTKKEKMFFRKVENKALENYFNMFHVKQ